MSHQVIDISAGAVEYTWPVSIIETTGKDLTYDTVYVSMGSYENPGTWIIPDYKVLPNVSTIVVRMLISAALNLTPGTSYYLWIKVSDAPEIVPRRVSRIAIA